MVGSDEPIVSCGMGYVSSEICLEFGSVFTKSRSASRLFGEFESGSRFLITKSRKNLKIQCFKS
jgi:hypothetical protein